MRRLKNKNLEFISASRRKNSESLFRLSRHTLAALLPVLLVLFFVGEFGYYAWKTAEVGSEARRISASLEEWDSTDLQQKIEHLGSSNATYQKFRNELDEFQKISDREPDFRGPELEAVFRLAQENLSVDQVEFAKGNLMIDVSSPDYRDGADYAGYLAECGEFTEVHYKGFRSQTEPDGSIRYLFQITAGTGGGQGGAR